MRPSTPIYFDYNATTPLHPSVARAMQPALEAAFGNPSSVHQLGRRARALLDDARERVAARLGSQASEIIFTSGGTESNNLAVIGTARANRQRGRHLITSTIEHPAVRRAFEYLAEHEGFEVSQLAVDSQGQVNPDDLPPLVRPDTILVSVMAANNEVGTLQPVSALADICHRHGILFHTDAVQWFGKEPFDSLGQFGADLVSLCGHKFCGPKGVGLLYLRSGSRCEPVVLGGPQENARRGGTENLAAILGLATAVESFLNPPVFPRNALRLLTKDLAEGLSPLPGITLRGHPTERLTNTVALTAEGADAASMLAALDLEGICASSGSACSSGSVTPSHVLLAMGVEHGLASSLVRLSLGPESTAAEVRLLVGAFPQLLARIRRHKL